MSRFRPIKRNTNFLFPPAMNDWVPEHHPARLIVEIVERLDLKAIENAYVTSGSEPFHAALLLSILIYGYSTGVFSSRKLEAATYDALAFCYIAADEHIDHDTLNSFRKRFLNEFKELTCQVLLKIDNTLRSDPLSRFTELPPFKENQTEVEKMRHNLKTSQGRELYAKRKCTVEPVIGIIKQIMGFHQFSLRVLEKVKGEFSLVAQAWNLKRMAVLRPKFA